jgi:hypothetical protein
MEKIPITEAQYNTLAKYGNNVIQSNAVQLTDANSILVFIKTLRAKIVDYGRDNYGFWMTETQVQNVFKRMSEMRLTQ